jgi:ABC-type transporter Mla subunit MlaD
MRVETMRTDPMHIAEKIAGERDTPSRGPIEVSERVESLSQSASPALTAPPPIPREAKIYNPRCTPDIAKLSSEATSLLSEFRETNRGLKALVCSPELAKLPSDVGETVSSARRIATSVENQLPSLLQSLRSVTERADALAESLNGIATNSSGQVQQTVAALSQTAQTLNRTALSQQSALTELIQNLRNASAGLDQIVSDLHTTPSALLFSTPPDPLPETRGNP